ncbi:MAG: NTP transferase domain-containing protein [Nitrospirae bacterium YQR-1]
MADIKLRAVAFVPVRLNSSRLPEKHLKYIGRQRTLLSWVILRLKGALEIDDIVICTTCEKENEQLRDAALLEGVSFFAYDGGVDDVVGRLTAASVKYRADICVLASGDCPLLSSETIDLMVKTLRENTEADNVLFSDVNGRQPIHEGIIVSRRKLWQLADKYSDTPALREHQFPVFLRNVYPDKFAHIKNVYVKDNEIFYNLNHRISIDTPDDLKFINRLFFLLQTQGSEFNLKNAITAIIENPEICNINKHVYRKTLEDVTLRVAFFVSPGTACGYDNLRRALEIAGVLVNRFGLGVGFFVPDDESKKFVQMQGLRADTAEAGKLVDFHKDFSFNAVVFDIDNNYYIDRELIDTLRTSVGAKVIVISNIFRDSICPDMLIASTLNYTVNNSKCKVKSGKDYIVIPQEIKDATIDIAAKEDKLVIYSYGDSFIPRLAEKLSEQDIGFRQKFYDSVSAEFLSDFASSKVLLCTMGNRAYEAIYLNCVPIIVSVNPKESHEIAVFNRYLKELKPHDFENGAVNIAKVIVDLLEK